jgi:hypothetical protein
MKISEVYSTVYVLLLTRGFSMKISEVWMCTPSYFALRFRALGFV